MTSIVDVLVKDPKVETKIISNIEHGAITKVRAIVVHRTSASTAESTLSAWKAKKSGAHFLIDKDGKIYQTAHINKKCWHMGLVMSRCRLEDTCRETDGKIIHDTLHGSGSWSNKFRNVLQHERKKDYPARYPMNSDSVGIELVGAYLADSGDKGPFEKLSKLQAKSFLWLITVLLSKYDLAFDEDIYAHGRIAHKKVNEGTGAVKWLQENYQ